MSSLLVLLVYVVALGLPLLALYLFGARAWYWHILSLAAALAVGLTPPPAGWEGPAFDLLCGGLFVALGLWGVGGLAIHRRSHPRHKHA
jgi:hypothetical protein